MKVIMTAFLISLFLTACSTASRVPNLGPGVHSLIANVAEGGEVAARIRATEKATKYCKAMGKELQKIAIKTVSMNMSSVGSVRITFRCVSPDELKKPE